MNIRCTNAIKTLVILLIVAVAVPLHARHFKVLDVSDGLPNNTVKCITQDRQGFIWIGTFDGLCRFDGVSFTVFRHVPTDSLSVADNHVEALLAEEEGLWVGTQSGLCFYSFQEQCFHPCYRQSAKGEKQRIGDPIKNILRIGTTLVIQNVTHELLCLTGQGTFEPCPYEGGESCLCVAAYKDGLLLMQSADAIRLIQPEQGKVVGKLDFREGESDDNLLFYSKHKDIVYVGYGMGHDSKSLRINDEFRFEVLDMPVPSDLKSVTDCGGSTYFGTDGNGLFELTDETMTHFTPADSHISSDAIHSLFADHDGNLWIGTYRGGLDLSSARYDWFNSLTMTDKQLTQGVVTAVFPYKEKIYIGLDGGGLNVYDRSNGTTTAYTTANSPIAGNNVLSICGDGQYVWLGIYGKGLCRYSPSQHTFKTYPLPPADKQGKSNRIWEIKDDGRGFLWVIGQDVCLFDKASEKFSFLNGLHDIGASGIRFDGDVAWIGSTSKGIYKIDRSTGTVLKHYAKETEGTSLPSNCIRYLYLDTKHRLWFATDSPGVCLLDDSTERVTSLGEREGLTERTVVCIQEDSLGYYWFATGNGLFRYDSSREAFVRIGKEDNLPFLQFNYNACAVQADLLYFGAVGGLVWFKPEEVRYHGSPNRVYFTDIELFNKERKHIRLNGEHPEEVHLPYDQNFLTIHFSTPELVSPAKVAFSCRMENFEQGWQDISLNRKLSYTNLPPGKYKFLVRATRDDGGWSEPASCLRIVITPPWWETGWAYCLWGVLALAALCSLFGFYRHELNIKHAIRLKELEKNTAKSISEAKLNFFTNITHELRTPIFLITAPIEELLASGKSPVQVPRTSLSAIYRSAMRLNKLISRIIDFRKLESGKLKLELQRQNVVAFCKTLTVDYEALCGQKEILFLFQPSSTVIPLDFDPEKLETILSNLVSNAFKYTHEGGHIVFTIDEADTCVRFAVEDNGIGIEKKYQEAVFDSFFQIDPAKAAGDGIGLSFVRHLCALHGGTVRVESTPGQGSKFIFTIPKRQPVVEAPARQRSVMVDDELPPLPARQETVTLRSPAASRSMLIVDDEQETVEVLERFFINDFAILKASNGIDGLAIARQSLPDIIICDVMMPRMDGMEFLGFVKGDKKLAHIPVVMFTAKTQEEDKMLAFDSGADAYLTKPISLRYLRKRIDQLLAKAESVGVASLLSKSERGYSKEEQRFLLRCKEVIDENLTNADFDIMFMADSLGMSHSTLYRKVKTLTGKSVIEFINEYRLFRAVQLFKEGETNIGAVCAKCGFGDIKNFRDFFKRKMKVSPKQFVSQL